MTGGHSSPRPRRVGRWAKRAVLSLVAVVVIVAAAAVIQLSRGVPPADASVVFPAQIVAPGTLPPMPWPKANAAEVDIPGIASLGGLHPNTVLPLASIAKLITALVVLHDHPLGPGQSGPTITITAVEAATCKADVQQSDSVLKVAAGEQLSELQALQGMLIASADNVADLLADWCSGTTTAFVEAMNAQAQSLGLTQTHLAGPAGVNPASTSTATNLIQLAADIMANPVLRPIVAMPQITLPVAGVVYNWDNVLGQDGIVGIKTGSTTQAGGNFVFAATRTIDKRPVTVLGVVLGAGGVSPLQTALNDSTVLAAAAFADLHIVTVLSAGQPVVRI